MFVDDLEIFRIQGFLGRLGVLEVDFVGFGVSLQVINGNLGIVDFLS